MSLHYAFLIIPPFRSIYLPSGESYEASPVDLEHSPFDFSDVLECLPLGDWSALNVSGFSSIKTVSLLR